MPMSRIPQPVLATPFQPCLRRLRAHLSTGAVVALRPQARPCIGSARVQERSQRRLGAAVALVSRQQWQLPPPTWSWWTK